MLDGAVTKSLKSWLRYTLCCWVLVARIGWHAGCVSGLRPDQSPGVASGLTARGFPAFGPSRNPGPLPRIPLLPRTPSPNPRTATCSPRQVALFFSQQDYCASNFCRMVSIRCRLTPRSERPTLEADR